MARNQFFMPARTNDLAIAISFLSVWATVHTAGFGERKSLKLTRSWLSKSQKSKAQKTRNLAEGEKLVEKEASHPNVVRVYWMDRVPPEKEWYAIEMEYFPSVTLAQLLDEGETGFIASYAKILDVYAKIVSGVEYLPQPRHGSRRHKAAKCAGLRRSG